MTRPLLCLIAGLTLAAFSHPAAADSASPQGLWLTENHRSVIDVEPCSSNPKNYCGFVYWIIDGGMQRDSKNPDAAQRDKSMCGLQIMAHFVPEDATHWIDGDIYKADDGDDYHATMEMLGNGKLEVRGYVGIPLLGKSQTWTRVNAKDYPRCKPGK